MFGTTHSCPADASLQPEIVLHREHEVGLLLPQFMGALASEISGSGTSDRCLGRSGDSMFSGLRASFMQLLKRRS